MKKLIGYFLFLVSSVYLFLALGVFLLISYVIPVEKLDPSLKRIIHYLMKLSFVRTQVDGLENLEPDKGYVFIPNHQSFFDALILVAYIPNYIRGVEIEDHFSWPIYGKFIARFGNIPIDPTSIKKSMASFKKAGEDLENGKSIVVFPEGERTLNGEIGEFKRLPFLFVKETQKDIVPIGISGLYDVLPRGVWWISPGHAKLSIGKPIPYSEYCKTDTKCLVEEVKKQVSNLSGVVVA